MKKTVERGEVMPKSENALSVVKHSISEANIFVLSMVRKRMAYCKITYKVASESTRLLR